MVVILPLKALADFSERRMPVAMMYRLSVGTHLYIRKDRFTVEATHVP